jgi:hypothetical protein
MCSGKRADGFKCKFKATHFPITEHKNISRQHYCEFHWRKFSRFYDNEVVSKNGVIVGQLKDLLERTEDDETLEVRENIHSPFNSTSIHETYDSTYREPELSLFGRLRKWLRKFFQ